VLDPTTLDTVRREMARILDGARAVTSHTDMYDLEPGHRPEDPRVRRVKTPHRFFPVFQQLLRHPRLVAVLQDLLGPSLRLTGSKINLKSPRYGSPVEWHQDWRSIRTPTTISSRWGSCSTTARATTVPSWWCRAVIAGPSSITTPRGISAEPSIPGPFATRSRGRCPSPAARAP